jgi:hypothetical protein
MVGSTARVSLLLCICLFGAFSCVQSPTIGLNPHQFNYAPQKVIYFFLPGLDYSHLEFSFVDQAAQLKGLVYRKFICQGQAINYNLKDLRPLPLSVLLMQMTGKLNQDATQCDAWKGTTFTQAFKEYDGSKDNRFFSLSSNKNRAKGDFPIFWVESGVNLDNSLLRSQSCPGEKWTDSLHYFLLNHRIPIAQDTKFKLEPYQMWGTDQRPALGFKMETSCQEQKTGAKKCINSKKEMFQKLTQKLASDKRYAFVWSDFDLMAAISEKNWKDVYRILDEYQDLLNFAVATASSETLILVTAASSMPLLYPPEGNAWQEMGQNDKASQKKWSWVKNNSSFGSPVFSYGASAENFCGIYESSEVYYRILRGLDNGQ